MESLSGIHCHDFSHDSGELVYLTEDGLLRVWETSTSRLRQEYLPTAHLSSSCTCLKWGSPLAAGGKLPEKKKRKKPSQVTTDGSGGDRVIAMGTATGIVNLYSVTLGDIKCQMKEGHSNSVVDVCWSDDSKSLYSGSSDGQIVEWDVTKAKQTRKWSAGKSGLCSLRLCDSNHLVTAGRSISLWNLETLTEEKNFTGHATDIIQLHTILTEESSIESLYIVSVARDDRVISLWTPSQKSSRTKRAKASFILENEPSWSSVQYDRDLNTLRIAVLTTAGTVELFEHQLNGTVSKKPVRPLCRLRVFTPAQNPLPVLACKLAEEHDKLHIMYGNGVRPGFDLVTLNNLRDSEMDLVREDPNTATSVTRVTAVGNVRQPNLDGDVTTLTPAVEGARKPGAKSSSASKTGKRPLEEPEVSLEERLKMLSVPDKPNPTGPVDSLATLLAQALQSNDENMLHKTLQTSDHKVINTTIRRLPPVCVLPLMKHLTNRLEKYGTGNVTNLSLLKWVRALLHVHTSYLATFGGLMERLQRMYCIMENRIEQLSTFTRLQGRLELMLSQLARQKDETEAAGATAALFTLQDESSEDEMMEDFDMLGANSESEDGYLSADEDDLVK